MDEQIISAIKLSLIVAVWSTLIGLPIAISLGYLLARFKFPGKALVSTLCACPIVLPPVVTGFLLLRLFGEQTEFGRMLSSLGFPIPFTLAGAVVASLVVGLPFYILSSRTAFELVDGRLIEVAKSLGKRPSAVFMQITLPLAAPGVMAGAVLAFARSLGEFGATAVLTGNTPGQTQTIALAVYALLDSPNSEAQVWTLVMFSLGIALSFLMAFEVLTSWQKRRMESYE